MRVYHDDLHIEIEIADEPEPSPAPAPEPIAARFNLTKDDAWLLRPTGPCQCPRCLKMRGKRNRRGGER